jgi:hypothetical protein
VTPDEIKNWKAEQAKRRLAVRLSEIPGHHAEAKPTQVASSQPVAKAEASYEDAKQLQQQE